MRILALSGSLRRDSLNTRLLRAAQELGGPGVEFVRYESLATIPPFTRSWSIASRPRCTSCASGSRRRMPC
jgi:chromate reductase